MYQLPPNNIHNWPTTGREGGKSEQTCCIVFTENCRKPWEGKIKSQQKNFLGKKKCVLQRSVQAQDSIDML